MLIASTVFLSIGFLQALPPSPRYPADSEAILLRDLSRDADVVAIVSFDGREPIAERTYTVTGGEPGSMPFSVDRLQLLDCAIGAVSGRLRSVYPLRFQRVRGESLPSYQSGKKFIFVGMKPVQGRLLWRDFPTVHTATSYWSTATQDTSEVAGLMLIPTQRGTVAAGPSISVRILRSLQEALVGAPAADVRRVCWMLEKLTNPADDERVDSAPIGRWVRDNMASDMLTVASGMNVDPKLCVLSVLMMWKVRAAESAFLDALVAADGANLGSLYLPMGLAAPDNDGVMTALRRVRRTDTKNFLLLQLVGKPRGAGDVAFLVGMLGDAAVDVRYKVLSKFATWTERDDLKPAWTDSLQTAIEREQELIDYWRAHPPG